VEVNKRGDSISVEGVMRLDLKDGKWLSCDWNGKRIGDNIDLVKFVQPGSSFPEAVFQLTGNREELPTRIAPREKEQSIRRPSIPYERGKGAGRTYLRDVRGISEASIKHAEDSGALRYLDNGVLFTGRDVSKAIRSATIRHIEPVTAPDGKVISKRDFADSDKAFPAVLPGSRSKVVVVEGGINALAVRDIAIRAGQAPPIIIATGGVGVRKWIRDNPELREILEQADQVEIMGEREVKDGKPDPVKQAETDARRKELADEIAGARQGEVPAILMPPPGIKDAAELNAEQVRQAIERQLAAQKEAARLARLAQESGSPGPKWR
jgi:hypothetical protein